MIGLVIESDGPMASVGEICSIQQQGRGGHPDELDVAVLRKQAFQTSSSERLIVDSHGADVHDGILISIRVPGSSSVATSVAAPR